LDTQKDLFDDWLESIENTNTRNGYGPYLKKLFDKMGVTAEEMKARLKQSTGEPWREAKKITNPDPEINANPIFTLKGREIALCALRHFIRYCDLYPPNDKIPKAPKAKRTPYMKWEQALKICDAATPPYRWIFRLQAHCGWGIGEFLKFNSKAENWERARHGIIDGKEYFRFDFPGRKRNPKPWYTLIPTFVLKEIFEANSKFPLTTTRGKPLDPTNYHSSVVLLESAFKNAANRAALKFDPMPSPHEFRDTFQTHCTKSGVIREIKQFAMGHKVDPLGYEKCMGEDGKPTDEDLEFVWSEVRKAYGPGPVEIGKVKEENQELRERIAKLEEKEEARKKPDDIMNQLFEDPEVLEVIKRKVKQLQKT